MTDGRQVEEKRRRGKGGEGVAKDEVVEVEANQVVKGGGKCEVM